MLAPWESSSLPNPQEQPDSSDPNAPTPPVHPHCPMVGTHNNPTWHQIPWYNAGHLTPSTPTIQLQTQLGWDQIYQGRILIVWAKAIDIIHPTMAKSGEQVMINIVQTIWTYILDTLRLNNQHLHHNTNQLNLQWHSTNSTTSYPQWHKRPDTADPQKPSWIYLPQSCKLGPARLQVLQSTASKQPKNRPECTHRIYVHSSAHQLSTMMTSNHPEKLCYTAPVCQCGSLESEITLKRLSCFLHGTNSDSFCPLPLSSPFNTWYFLLLL